MTSMDNVPNVPVLRPKTRDSEDIPSQTQGQGAPDDSSSSGRGAAEREAGALRELVEVLRAENAWLQGRIEAAEREKERLFELMPRRLPPARRSWWPFGQRREGEGHAR